MIKKFCDYCKKELGEYSCTQLETCFEVCAGEITINVDVRTYLNVTTKSNKGRHFHKKCWFKISKEALEAIVDEINEKLGHEQPRKPPRLTRAGVE